MERDRQNFISLLDNEKISVFCAYDQDYNIFKANSFKENLFFHLGFKGILECVFMDQIHSNLVQNYDINLKNLTCDGLITKKKNTALCVLSADCLPLLLYHEDGIIAALHSGRKGSFDNILKKCIEKIILENPNLDKTKFHLFIMPSICWKDYEINGDILNFAKENFRDFLLDNRLDLKSLIKFQAKELNINHILDSEICSFENKDFFSYRRNKTQKRFVSVIYLKD
ncbi:polyphenol oxidase family protein [Campylobacter molothri]|uniref:polyphenol oxidase family protein n=1 Tax=Campylobacter molothri TaxID=1032242 RepID=UPI001EFA6C6D|nr:laccase domain-containing protein [Campylobacter sp. RM10537]MBZ7949393.1 laccase domain-containing protein [Campylobacter sp. RM10534]ULN99518.1 multi-copper polyphenol oxidoreductase laccase [Campylobacter sp. RM10537]